MFINAERGLRTDYTMVYMERVRLPKIPSSWQPLLNAGRLVGRLAEESPVENQGTRGRSTCGLVGDCYERNASTPPLIQG